MAGCLTSFCDMSHVTLATVAPWFVSLFVLVGVVLVGCLLQKGVADGLFFELEFAEI